MLAFFELYNKMYYHHVTVVKKDKLTISMCIWHDTDNFI